MSNEFSNELTGKLSKKYSREVAEENSIEISAKIHSEISERLLNEYAEEIMEMILSRMLEKFPKDLSSAFSKTMAVPENWRRTSEVIWDGVLKEIAAGISEGIFEVILKKCQRIYNYYIPKEYCRQNLRRNCQLGKEFPEKLCKKFLNYLQQKFLKE